MRRFSITRTIEIETIKDITEDELKEALEFQADEDLSALASFNTYDGKEIEFSIDRIAHSFHSPE